MKKVLMSLLMSLALVFTLVAVSNSAEASDFRTVKAVSGSSLVVKAAASPSAKTIATLKKGDFVTVFSTTNGWAKIESKGVSGFVNASFLSTPKSTIKIASSKSGLVVKNLPTMSTKTSATLKYNMIVEDFGSVGGGWSFVQYGNVTGYVNSSFIGVPKTTKKYTAADVIVRNIASPSGAQVGTIKSGNEVTVHSTLVGWSYVTTGSVKGYVVDAQLTTKKPAAPAATGLGFFQGLVPKNIKNGTDYTYEIYSSFGLDGIGHNKFVYTGSQAAGSYKLVMSNGDYDDEYSMYVDTYEENKQGFTYHGRLTSLGVVKVDYPVKVGNKKTYSAPTTVYNENGDESKKTKSYTTTVKAANTTYVVRDNKVPNAVVIELLDSGKTTTLVFQLNKGLVYSESKWVDKEEFGDEELSEIGILGETF